MEKIKIFVNCHMCDKEHTVEVFEEDYHRWEAGELIQDAMPYLSAGERELLISGTCESCFYRLFGVGVG